MSPTGVCVRAHVQVSHIAPGRDHVSAGHVRMMRILRRQCLCQACVSVRLYSDNQYYDFVCQPQSPESPPSEAHCSRHRCIYDSPISLHHLFNFAQAKPEALRLRRASITKRDIVSQQHRKTIPEAPGSSKRDVVSWQRRSFECVRKPCRRRPPFRR